MFRSKEDGFLVGSFNFDAVSFNGRIVFQGVVDDTPVEGIQRLKFHDITPATDLFRGFFGFLDQGVPLLRTVIADIQCHFRALGIQFEDHAIGDVLELAQGLTLPADQAARVGGLDIEKNLSFHIALVDRGFKPEGLEQLFENRFCVCCHKY